MNVQAALAYNVYNQYRYESDDCSGAAIPVPAAEGGSVPLGACVSASSSSMSYSVKMTCDGTTLTTTPYLGVDDCSGEPGVQSESTVGECGLYGTGSSKSLCEMSAAPAGAQIALSVVLFSLMSLV